MIGIQDSTENERRIGDEGEEQSPDTSMDTEAEGEEATPEEQMDFDMLTVRARKMIFGKGRENILKTLGTAETPAKGMGRIGATIMKSLVSAAKDAGREISPDAAVAAAPEILQDLVDVAKSNKIFEFDTPEDEEKALTDAILWGVKYYGDGEIANGEITPQMREQAKQQVQAGLAAEQARAPQKKPVAAGVEQAMTPPEKPAGLVSGAMQGGM